jgi:hypothetical protein
MATNFAFTVFPSRKTRRKGSCSFKNRHSQLGGGGFAAGPEEEGSLLVLMVFLL